MTIVLFIAFLVNISLGNDPIPNNLYKKIEINAYIPNGELGGRNEAFRFERLNSGKVSGQHVRFRKNSYGIKLDSLAIASFYDNNVTDCEILKKWILDTKQVSYLDALVDKLKSCTLSNNVHSNAPEYYYIILDDTRVLIIDRARELKVYSGMKMKFGLSK